MTATENRRLSSWKQIARYLGRDRRTVMRWEQKWGMPVRRPGGEARGSTVYAYTAELDAWLEGGGPGRAGEAPPDGPLGERDGAGRRRLAVGLPAAVAIVVVGVLGMPRRENSTARPAEVITAGDMMTVLAVDGSVVWTYRHPEGYAFHESSRWSRFVDLDGDRADELLLGINTASPDGEVLTRGELFAFGSDRELTWRITPTDSLTFGDEAFGPPWTSATFDVATLNGETRVVWGVHHATWWPSILTILSPEGDRVGRFVNSGWLLAGAKLARPEGDVLLVGGISNARRSAMLAVLDPRDLDATSPEDAGSPYECVSCSQGRPLRYVLFGPSHVNVASSLPYNRTVSVENTESGFKVVVVEGGPGSDVHWVYEFSRDLDLLGATPGDTYWPQHERLRLQGLIDHGEEDCAERAGSPPVSVWTPDEGWQAVSTRPRVTSR